MRAQGHSDFFLVEDDAFDIKFVQRLVETFDPPLTFEHFLTGDEALVRLRQCPIDQLPKFLLVDINMPRMDGIELIGHLRRLPHLAEVAMVVVTSSDSPHDRAAAQKLGVHDYVVKSTSSERLRSVMSSLL